MKQPVTTLRDPYDIDFHSPNAKLPWLDKIVHSIHSAFSFQISWMVFSYYLMFFYTDVVGLPATIAGTIMLFSRVFDCITDIIMGYLLDNKCLKWGKYRSWIIIGALPVTLLFIGTFTAFPGASDSMKIVWASLCYGCFGAIGATICFLPSTAQMINMTKNVKERATIATLKGLFTNVAQVVAASLFLPLVNFFAGPSENLVRGYFGAATVTALFALVFIIWNIIITRKYELNRDGSLRDHLKVEGEHESLFSQLKDLGTNRPALVLNGGMFLHQVMLAVRSGMIVYIFTYYLNLMDFHSTAVFANTLAMVLGILLVKPLIRLIGDTNRAYMTTILGNAIISLAMYFLMRSMGTEGSAASMQYGLIFVLFVLNGVLLGTITPMFNILLPNTVDYGTWKTGRQQSGFVSALYGFSITIGAALGGQIFGILLDGSGYVANVAQSDSTLNVMLLIAYLVPGVLLVLQFILQAFFGLTDAKLAQYVAETGARQQHKES